MPGVRCWNTECRIWHLQDTTFREPSTEYIYQANERFNKVYMEGSLAWFLTAWLPPNIALICEVHGFITLEGLTPLFPGMNKWIESFTNWQGQTSHFGIFFSQPDFALMLWITLGETGVFLDCNVWPLGQGVEWWGDCWTFLLHEFIESMVALLALLSLSTHCYWAIWDM